MIELKKEYYFASPIWYIDAPQFLKKLDKASDSYIKEAQQLLKPTITERKKKYKVNKGDFGLVAHSKSLIPDANFKEFMDYSGNIAVKLLDEMGYDLTNYRTAFTELWVQEFAKKGGGHHAMHTHWNGHISGFYFLKADESTSLPMFEDPRPGNVMNLLPEKDKTKVTYASSAINYQVKPGRIMFFPSYLPHQYIVDMGYNPFRFIHWNCQAIPKGVLNVV